MKMLRYFLLILIFFYLSCTYQDDDDNDNFESYQGGNHGTEIQETTDGGFIIGGTERVVPTLAWHIKLFKTDSSGNLIWASSYGEPSARGGVLSTDGNSFLLTGEISLLPNTNFKAIYLLKTDNEGHEVWSKSIRLNLVDSGQSIKHTNDGGAIITGNTWGNSQEGCFLLKVDSQGDTDWTKIFVSADLVKIQCVQQTIDDGYIIVGHAAPRLLSNLHFGGFLNYHILIMKTDSNGNVMWLNKIDEGVDSLAYSIALTNDGGYIITGAIGEKFRVYVIKLFADGGIEWFKKFRNTKFRCGNSIQTTNDGGFIITGAAKVNDVFLLKIDCNGNEVWSLLYGGNNTFLESKSVIQTSDRGYIITGSWYGHYDKLFLLKVDEHGTEEWANFL